MGFKALESSFQAGLEVGHGKTHDWGGRRATLDPVGVATNRQHSRRGDRRRCSPVWRFIGHGSVTNCRGV